MLCLHNYNESVYYILQVLAISGYTHLVLQVGSGPEPQIPVSDTIKISWYRLKESILPDMEAASLIISHAGAGSCLEALGVVKPVIVVVNQNLMGNHQLELASKLQSEGHVLMCYPESLCTVINDLKTATLKPFPQPNHSIFSSYIENLMGL